MVKVTIPEELVEMINHWQDNIKQPKGYELISYKVDLSVKESLGPAAFNKKQEKAPPQTRLNPVGEVKAHSFCVDVAVDLLGGVIRLERIMLRGG